MNGKDDLSLNEFNYSYEKKRFQTEAKLDTAPVELDFSSESKILLIKAIKAAIQSSTEHSGQSKVLPLQGIVDLTNRTLHIGALTPRDADAFVFNEKPLFEHKKPGLFDGDQYSPRMKSYQLFYSAGPSAHQQLLKHVVNKPQVSSDDAKDKLGFAMNIKVSGADVTITIDGKSLSINETAQYLRTVHKPGHVLSEQEAKNSVLKEEGIYSDMCESWVFNQIADACKGTINPTKENTSVQQESPKANRSQFFAEGDKPVLSTSQNTTKYNK